MSDPDKPDKAKWGKVDTLIRRDEQPLATTDLPPGRPLAVIEAYTEKARAQKLDLIGRFKLGAIQRNAALDTIRSMHEAQLEATKHALLRAVEVDKSRVDLIAKKYIYEITQEYLHDMGEFGIHNYQARIETALRLNEVTAQLLQNAQLQDIPEKLREGTIEAILKKHKEFFAQLTAEEIKLS